jgi:hypothetical protein
VSIREEIIAGIYIIAAIQAWQAGIKWLAVILSIKAGADTACSIIAAVVESYREVKAKKAAQ